MHKAYKKGFISSAATDDILTGADPENAPKVKDPRMYSKRAQKLVERVAKIRRHKELLAEFLKQGAWSVDLTSTDWIAQPKKSRGKKSKRSPTPVDDPSMRSPLRTTDTSTQSPGSKRTVSAEKMVRRMTVNMADTVSRMTSLKHSHEKQRVEIAALKAVATETLLEITDYSSSSAGNAEREQQRSTRSRPQLQIKPRDTPAAPFSCCLLSGMSVGEPYYDVRKTPRATSHKAPSANAPSTRKKQEARRSKKQEEEGSRQLRPMRLAKKARWRMKDGPHYLFWM